MGQAALCRNKQVGMSPLCMDVGRYVQLWDPQEKAAG